MPHTGVCTVISKTDIGEAVMHFINSHSTEELKIRKLEKIFQKQYFFREIAREHGRVLTVNEEIESIRLLKLNSGPKDSPLKNCTDLQNVHPVRERSSLPKFQCNLRLSDENESVNKEFVSLHPDVINGLKDP